MGSSWDEELAPPAELENVVRACGGAPTILLAALDEVNELVDQLVGTFPGLWFMLCEDGGGGSGANVACPRLSPSLCCSNQEGPGQGADAGADPRVVDGPPNPHVRHCFHGPAAPVLFF